MNWHAENGIGGETVTGIRWREPDMAQVETWRAVALGEAESAVRALEDAGHTAHVYGSVLRSAYQPFGFHPRSDVDLLAAYSSSSKDSSSDEADIWAIAESEVRSARLSCLMVPNGRSDFIRPFDPAEILRRSVKRLQQRSCFLQRMVARSEAAAASYDAAAYQDPAGFQLAQVRKAMDRILKVVVHGHLGWLPEINGPFTRRDYQEILVELAAGTAATSALISSRELALFRAGYISQPLRDAAPLLGDCTAAVIELVPVLCRLVDTFADPRAKGSAESCATE